MNKSEKSLFLIWLILWLLVPIIGIFTAGIFFVIVLILTFFVMLSSFDAIKDMTTQNRKEFMTYMGMLLLFFLPSIIVLSIGFILKRYKPKIFKFYAYITIFFAILIILLLLYMTVTGKFSIHDA